MSRAVPIRFWAARTAAGLAPALPAAAGYVVAGWLGDVLRVTSRTMRRRYDDNVTHALGVVPNDLSVLRRTAFRNLAWNYLELVTLATSSQDRLRAAGTIEGLADALSESTSRGRTGAVLAFGHVGNLEMLSHLGVLLPGERFAVVVEHMADEDMNRLLNGCRRCHGLEVIPADEPRRILTALRSGSHLILACDYDSTGGGVVVPLFGRPARMPVGAVRLALSTGALLFVVEGWRDRADDPRHFRARVRGPVPLARSENREGDLLAGVATLAAMLEQHVVAHPGQWLAFREIWCDA